MNYIEIQSFLNKHCRIKLRSGKEVFGVLWEEFSETERALYFASNIEHKRLMKKKQPSGMSLSENLKLKVNFDDILGLESLS